MAPHVFPGSFTPGLTQLFFPKSPTTFLTCFCRVEMPKYDVMKVRLNRRLNSQPPGHTMVPHVFSGLFTPVLTQLFFQKSPTTFLTCFCKVEMRKYDAKKVRFNQGLTLQPPGHESDTLTTEPPR